MIYSITASQDTTLLTVQPYQNTGLDEILEIRKSAYGDISYISRALIKFDLKYINIVMDNIGKSPNPKVYLKLYSVDANQIPINYSIYAYPVSQSWDMGSGRFADIPIITDSANWIYRTAAENYWATASYADFTTGSGNGGGTWYTSSYGVQEFNYQKADLELDVTNIYNAWYAKDIPNEGIILKFLDTTEEDSVSYGTLQFYSKDTHTIYQPKLEFRWTDFTYDTTGLNPLDTTVPITVQTKNLKANYANASKVRFDVQALETYVRKTYNTHFATSSISCLLESSSCYSISDAHTDETIIPFDEDYTKLSCDNRGNFFYLWLDQLEPERYYRINYKVNLDNETLYFKDNNVFKTKK